MLGEVGAGACWGFCSLVEPLADEPLLPMEEPDEPAEPLVPPEAAEPWLSLFFSVEDEDAPALPPDAAEPSLLPAEDEDLPEAPPAAEPLTPRAASVFWSS